MRHTISSVASSPADSAPAKPPTKPSSTPPAPAADDSDSGPYSSANDPTITAPGVMPGWPATRTGRIAVLATMLIAVSAAATPKVRQPSWRAHRQVALTDRWDTAPGGERRRYQRTAAALAATST